MLTTREIASLILLGIIAIAFLVVPRLRLSVGPHIGPLVRLALSRRLLMVYGIVVLVSAGSTALAWNIGLWDWDLTKDAIILTAAVVLPMTFRSFTFKSGGGLALHLIRDTLGLAALLTFYLDATPLPLVGELILQPLVTLLVALQAFARTDAKYTPAKRFCDAVLLIVGAFLLVWSSVGLFSSSPDWWELLRSLLFNFWLPLSLLPFFYLFGFCALTEKVRSRFRALKRPFTPRLMLAFMIGTRLRMSLLAEFNGRYNGVAEASGFRDGLRRMRDFRTDVERREREETLRLSTLERNAGAGGVDEDGRHADRREFDVTKNASTGSGPAKTASGTVRAADIGTI